MKPQIVHRYAFAAKDAVEALLGGWAAGSDSWEIKIVGDQVVVDIIPWEVPSSIEVPAEGIDHEKLAVAIEKGDFRPEPEPSSQAEVIDLGDVRLQKAGVSHPYFIENGSPADAYEAEGYASADVPNDPKGGHLARRAAILCAEGGFQTFLEVDNKEAARAELCRRCGVKRRSYLDHDERAAAIWKELESGYQMWLKGYD